jgi:hypothetical protein
MQNFFHLCSISDFFTTQKLDYKTNSEAFS